MAWTFLGRSLVMAKTARTVVATARMGLFVSHRQPQWTIRSIRSTSSIGSRTEETEEESGSPSPPESADTIMAQVSKKLKAYEAAGLLISLSQTEDAAIAAKDARLPSLLASLEGDGVRNMTSGQTLAALKAMHALEVPNSCMAHQNLENTLLFRARSASISHLCMMLSYAHGRTAIAGSPQGSADSLSERLLREVVRTFERRWVEIVDGRTFCSLLHYPECFSETFLNKIDDRIAECAESLVLEDLVLVLSKLGNKGRRSVPLLKTLLYHVGKNAAQLDEKQISDCLFTMKKLSLKDKVEQKSHKSVNLLV